MYGEWPSSKGQRGGGHSGAAVRPAKGRLCLWTRRGVLRVEFKYVDKQNLVVCSRNDPRMAHR